MSRLVRLVFAVLLLAIVALIACKGGGPRSPDVWAEVNGKEILRSDVERYYKKEIAGTTETPSEEEALSLKLNILGEVIRNEILMQKAAKLGLLATDSEVENRFTEMKTPFTEDEFQKRLKEQGLTVEQVKTDLRRNISIEKLFNKEITSKITITDADIATFYQVNKPAFNVVEPQYRVAQILVTPRPDLQLSNLKNDDARNDAEARTKIRRLLERAQAGEDFSQLAQNYSEDLATVRTGGDLGYFPASALNQTDPALRRAIQNLKAGETSGVIQTRIGYHILKLLAKELAGQRELSDPQVQASIRKRLFDRKDQLLKAAYFEQARNEAKATNYLARQILESSGKLPMATH